MRTILVEISDRQWTVEALHLACAMARSTHQKVALLHLMPVKSAFLLGAGVGIEPPTEQDYEDFSQYESIAEDYGLELTLRPMQYESHIGALSQAAEYTDAAVLFAHLPEHGIPFLRQFRLWNLRRELSAQRCQLYTLDGPQQAETWVPSVSMKVAK